MPTASNVGQAQAGPSPTPDGITFIHSTRSDKKFNTVLISTYSAYVGNHRIGFLTTAWVPRSHINAHPEDFCDITDVDLDDPCEMPIDLLEQDTGFLKTEFSEDPIKRGTGAWGAEVNNADIMIIDFFSVEKEWWRRKVGTRLFQYMRQCVRDDQRAADDNYIVFVKPLGFIHTMDLDQDGIEDFYRSLGFRRVGNSRWFAFSADEDHPARRLSAERDREIRHPRPFRTC